MGGGLNLDMTNGNPVASIDLCDVALEVKYTDEGHFEKRIVDNMAYKSADMV